LPVNQPNLGQLRQCKPLRLYFLQHFFLHSIPPFSPMRAFSPQKPIRSGKSAIWLPESLFTALSTEAKLMDCPLPKKTSDKNHLNRGWQMDLVIPKKKNTLDEAEWQKLWRRIT
jgi:hypothetical protein